LLDRSYAHGDRGTSKRRPVREVARTSINPDNGGSPLLFPFLILEAKQENSITGFDGAEVQSSLPILEALKLQYDLMKVTGNSVEVPGGPLVWYLAKRGEDWRVYAAYVNEHEGSPKFVSLSGCYIMKLSNS
jgi:hypothetical protein